MNCSDLAYDQATSTATYSGIFVGYTFAGIAPRKGWRTPLDKNRYSEQRDEGTGLSHFGARYSTSFRDVSWQRPQASLGALLLKRYYDADLTTGWLSVDPMADKYPSMSPYGYCALNPMRLVDPDGREIGDYYSVTGKYLGSDWYDDKKYMLHWVTMISNNSNSHREYGGSIFQDADGNQHIYVCNPGPEYSKGDVFSYVGKHDWSADYVFDGLTLVTDFHTHHRDLTQFPSKQDRLNVLNERGERYGGASCPYNIMLAMGSKQLFFYDSKRTYVAKWSFSTVERILGRK